MRCAIILLCCPCHPDPPWPPAILPLPALPCLQVLMELYQDRDFFPELFRSAWPACLPACVPGSACLQQAGHSPLCLCASLEIQAEVLIAALTATSLLLPTADG
jgi:hypothetical protein